MDVLSLQQAKAQARRILLQAGIDPASVIAPTPPSGNRYSPQGEQANVATPPSRFRSTKPVHIKIEGNNNTQTVYDNQQNNTPTQQVTPSVTKYSPNTRSHNNTPNNTRPVNKRHQQPTPATQELQYDHQLQENKKAKTTYKSSNHIETVMYNKDGDAVVEAYLKSQEDVKV